MLSKRKKHVAKCLNVKVYLAGGSRFLQLLELVVQAVSENRERGSVSKTGCIR
jgi:hypothetical protein